MGSIFGWYSHLFWHDAFEGYMLGDWVKLTVAIGGGLFWAWGTWRAFRFSKSQISQRLLEFLKTNEEEALNSRKNPFAQVGIRRDGRALGGEQGA